MCSVENCELENFKDNDKCILHCEKEDWYRVSENDSNPELFYRLNKVNLFKKILLDKFIFPKSSKIICDFFNNIAEIKNEIIIKDTIFKNGFEIEKIFKSKIKFENCYFHGELFLNECTFNSDIEFKNCVFKEELNFGSSIFKKEFKIINSKENMNKDDYQISILHLSGAKFKNVAKLKRLNIKKSDFDNCIFEDEADFYKTNFNLTSFKRTVFKGYTIFNKSLLTESFDEYENSKQIKSENFKQNKFEFKNTKFKNVVSFDNVTLEKDFDLRSALFYDKAIFLNLKKNANEDKISVSNRETARIIKDSFEKQNNIIEANKYYSLEMEKREDELNKDIKDGKNFFEYIVFLFHSITSNHSQNWLLALFWIIISTFGYTILDNYEFNDNFIYGTWIFVSIVIALGIGFYLKDYINDGFTHIWMMSTIIFIFYLGYGFTLDDFELECFSSNVNPFSIFNQDGTLGFLDLIYRIIIAYLIYQLIISIRQNTRRK